MEKLDKISHLSITCMVSRQSLASIEELQGHYYSQHETIKDILLMFPF